MRLSKLRSQWNECTPTSDWTNYIELEKAKNDDAAMRPNNRYRPYLYICIYISTYIYKIGVVSLQLVQWTNIFARATNQSPVI